MDSRLDALRIKIVAARTVRVQAILARCIDELQLLVSHLREPAEAQGRLSNLFGSGKDEGLYKVPIVDLSAMTITWSGRSCNLGYTVPLRLMQRLAQRPNHYLSFDRLLRDVWGGHEKTDDTIRSTVRHLKVRLRAAGMGELAEAIRSAGQRYGLILNQ